jgi:hypothetical protein
MTINLRNLCFGSGGPGANFGDGDLPFGGGGGNYGGGGYGSRPVGPVPPITSGGYGSGGHPTSLGAILGIRDRFYEYPLRPEKIPTKNT